MLTILNKYCYFKWKKPALVNEYYVTPFKLMLEKEKLIHDDRNHSKSCLRRGWVAIGWKVYIKDFSDWNNENILSFPGYEY